MKIVSFIGTGNYQPVYYYQNDKSRYIKTEYFIVAAEEFFKPDEIILLLTQEAMEKHIDILLPKIKTSCVKQILIPAGKTEDELWSIFSLIAEQVNDKESIIIDVTHGFRTQPMLVLAAAVFLKVIKNISVEKIVYGAFEARDNENYAPVFDLTPFLRIIEWSSATEQFLNYGNTLQLSNILYSEHERLIKYEKPEKFSSLKKFAKIISDLTNSLSLIRPEEVSLISKKMPLIVDDLKVKFNNIAAVKPLGMLLNKIPESLNSLSLSKNELFTKKGFFAQSQMISFYLETRQYPQAITLLRESIVSLLCIIESFDVWDKAGREKAETMLFDLSSNCRSGKQIDGKKGKLAAIWSEICNCRNDVNHAGMRKSASGAESLIKRTEKLCKRGIEIINAG
ncbi:MAG: TIGR02221 family CRISPR-associated protein [Ignavibacteria bacterium]|jgi:CRISPR-associated DxTHG motif protein|nr:TIGR02221 family CRISPR-associated protein [Ignavibacteria bacterium]MCU7504466.1 TIGR02221 family CRISPR-associated protein [Ignavibacteria bacterium]MCU7517955.1 TIGR02221 family CRISPR-associated protein [Ignavibacteria bacterium]